MREETQPDEVERQARARVRQAVQATVSLIAREVDEVNIAPAILIEGVDTEIVAQLLAAMMASVLGATLPDSGRTLLVRIGLQAAVEPDGDGEAGS